MNVRRFSISTAVGLAGLLLSRSIHAEEAAKWYETTKVSGFADAYYKFNPDGRKSGTSNTVEFGFDSHQNTFSVGGGKIELGSMDGMAVVDLYLGDYSKILQPAQLTPTAAPDVAVGQAFISQPLGPVTVTLGRFATHLGYEVTDSVSNLNFTRGLLFGAVPFYHQGVKFAYSPMEGLGLMAMLDNGNSVNYPTSNETAAGAQLSYTGMKGMSLYLNYYYQPLALWEKKHFIDVVASYAIMDGLNFGSEYLYFTSIANSDVDTAGNVTGTFMTDPTTGKKVARSPKTQGYAIYLDYATAMTGLSITPRFEALYAPDAGGATAVPVPGDGQTKFDYTLTARYVKGMLTNWLEFRTDASDDAIYLGPTNTPSVSSYTEMALTWGVGYKF